MSKRQRHQGKEAQSCRRKARKRRRVRGNSSVAFISTLDMYIALDVDRLTVKKLPMIHSKMAARPSSTGPVKKKIPTTPARLLALPKPIRIIEKVKVEMTKPVKPMGTALAKRFWLLP